MKKKFISMVLCVGMIVSMFAGCGCGKEQSQSAGNENVVSEDSADLNEIKNSISTFEFNEVIIDTENTWGSLIFTESGFYLYDAKAGDSAYDAYTQNEKLYVSKDGSGFERSRADIPSFGIYDSLLDAVAENLTYDNHTYCGSLTLAEVKDSFSDYVALMEYEGETLNKDTLPFTIDISNDEITLLIDDFYSLKYKTENDDPIELLKESILSNADTNLNGIICYNPDLDEELTLNEGNISVSDDFVLQVRVVDGETEKFIDVVDIEIMDSEVKINGVSYLLTTRLKYQENKDAEEKNAQIRNWKDAYIGYLNTIGFEYTDFDLVDLHDDDIPEFVYKSDGKYGMCYIDLNYTVHDLGKMGCITIFEDLDTRERGIITVSDVSANEYNALTCHSGNIYYYNEATGVWELIFEGVVNGSTYLINGEEIYFKDYMERFSELAKREAYKIDVTATSYHIESATDYIELYEVE